MRSKKNIVVLLAFICFVVIIIFYRFNTSDSFINLESESNDIYQERDKFLFAYPEYEIKEQETITITSREHMDNFDNIFGINEIIDNGFVLVQSNLVEKTEEGAIGK